MPGGLYEENHFAHIGRTAGSSLMAYHKRIQPIHGGT
jgi:hypothetical protein